MKTKSVKKHKQPGWFDDYIYQACTDIDHYHKIKDWDHGIIIKHGVTKQVLLY